MNSYTWGRQRGKLKMAGVHNVDSISAMETRLTASIQHKIENMSGPSRSYRRNKTSFGRGVLRTVGSTYHIRSGSRLLDSSRIETYRGWLGWPPLFYISGDYYPDLVREFYANMTHKTNKDLQTIISIVKGVRIILDRECLAPILWIPDNGNSFTMESNRKTIDEDLDWNFGMACSRFKIWPRALHHRKIIHGDDFPNLLHCGLAYFFGHTLVQKGTTLENEDYQQDRSRLLNTQLLITAVTLGMRRTKCGSHHLKQIVQDDDYEADESYNPSDDEDEADAQNTILMDAFQTKMQTAFEKLRINQEIQGM
ncbi:hypothetical protein M9H77_30603 [Catharanthus roseus]|uniref:Uncharacterized protein n=1 Tax=Catharanthus roseus TaxID=4058 RepID=A0ACC0A1M6_CATRO|nr:hypothetical protein M9H77_30603 [Catharanthus roseus]